MLYNIVNIIYLLIWENDRMAHQIMQMYGKNDTDWLFQNF